MKEKVFIGIDIGSVSTNLAVIDVTGRLLARSYLPTAGRPIEAVQRGLGEVRGDYEVAGAGTTGSGRYLIGELVGADIVRNEITAQAEGALYYDPRVDTIFEIGGQDSKYIALEGGVVIDFAMNKVCAAGTGSFLEEQADKLGISIRDDFARLALRAKEPCALGDRCTVFIESELNSRLQKGAGREELAAGLAVAIVKNYLNKVVENRRVGRRIFFQGGVAGNQAVVKAFGQVTGKEIVVPPNHDVTGAIGIALLASREVKGKSRFRGFELAGRQYAGRTFECRSCSNVCEINEVSVEREAPLFYGGRCEKWEKKKSPAGVRTLPNLFAERDAIVFGEREKGRGRRVGIPRVLFFFERYPFWHAFFTALGFEAVLSDPSNREMAEESLDHLATEACFPITLAHGHVQNLLRKGIDILFLPSLINMEKRSAKFRENFNCPFVQALPYFIKAGFDLPPGLRVLAPALEPQRGEKYFIRQLIGIGKKLGRGEARARAAVAAAEQAQRESRELLRERGRAVLEWIEKENIPAVAVIGRPYNGADPVLNLNIPKKLLDMGVLPLPLDYLPVDRADAAEDFPNMYWNYGQKTLAAAKYIARRPNLSALFITNFRCGPDSFISHLVGETIGAKPFLSIEVDEHASDTGVITRLEAFLDSLKNAGKKDTRTQNTESRTTRLSSSKSQSTGIKNRTIYLPHMCAHSHPLAAAMRASGVEAEVLPPSDAATLELGRRHTSGKECHPFIVTTGDFVKKLGERGFEPRRSAFFMPTASGPCRFGQYQAAQKIIFGRLGYGDVPIVSPDARDSYGTSAGLDLRFRRLAWQGIVAADLLLQLSADRRPYELTAGAVDRLFDRYLTKLTGVVGARGKGLLELTREMKEAFARLPLSSVDHKPLIGIVGEIFLRSNPHCNSQIVKRVERLGGRTSTAPISEWFYYTNLGYIYESYMRRSLRSLAQALLADSVQRFDEWRLGHRQPSALRLIRRASPYLHYTFKGEAVLTLGKAVDLVEHGAAGVINILPFTCMPGTVVAAAVRRLKERYPGLPWLDLAIDGSEGVNLETRLEAFMHQAASYNASGPRRPGQK